MEGSPFFKSLSPISMMPGLSPMRLEAANSSDRAGADNAIQTPFAFSFLPSGPLMLGFDSQGPLLSSVFRATPPALSKTEGQSELHLENLPVLSPLAPGSFPALQKVEASSAVEVPADYWLKIDAGKAALGELRAIAELAKNAGTPEEKERLKAELSRVDGLVKTAETAAELIRESATKGGLNEFSAIENFQNAAFDAFRKGSGDVSIEGVMIGFNMQGLNGLDPSMNSGTAFKELCAHFAPEAAREVGAVNAQFMGTWGSNLVVNNVPPEKTEAFRERLLDKVIGFLSTDQEFPSEGIKSRARSERTSQLSIPRGDWPKHRSGIGITIGYASQKLPRESLAKAVAGDRDSRLSVVRDIVGHLKEMGDREAFAAEEKVGIKKDAIADPHHPSIGKGVRPVLLGDRNPYAGRKLGDIPSFEPEMAPKNQLTLDDIHNLPSPARTGGLPLGQIRALKEALKTSLTGDGYDATLFQQSANDVLNAIDRPIGPNTAQNMMEFFEEAGDLALRDYTMPQDAYRIDALQAVAARVFKGGKFYIAQYDIKNFWKINKTFPSGYSDPLMKRLNWVLMSAHEQMGLQTVFLRQGDETYILTAPVTRDGRTVTPELLEKTQVLIETQGARLFKNYVAPEWGKYPGVMSGVHGDKTEYVVDKDGRVFVKKGALSSEEKVNFAETVRRNSQAVLGKVIDPSLEGQLVEVEDFKSIGVADRVAKAKRVTTDPVTGKTTTDIIFVPGGKLPAGYEPILGQPNWTQSAFVEKPDFRLGVEGNLAAAADLSGEDVKHQKSIVGPDALPEHPFIRLSNERQFSWVPGAELYVHLQSTATGRLALSGGSFGVGITGARLLVGVPVGAISGNWNIVRKVANPLEGAKLGVDFGIMTSAELATSAFLTRYMKLAANGKGVHVGGVLAATAAVEALHRGRDFSPVSVALGTGMTLGITQAAMRGVGAMKTRLLGAAALDPEPLTKLGGMAVSFLVMEGIGAGVELYHDHQIDQLEAEKRQQYGNALRRLDYAIEKLAQGRASESDFATAAKAVKYAYVEYAGLLQLYRTPSGRTYREAWAAEQPLRKTEIEQDFKARVKRAEGRPTTFIPVNPAAEASDYRRHIAAEPGELSEQFDSLISKRVKILLERMNQPVERMDHYLSMFTS